MLGKAVYWGIELYHLVYHVTYSLSFTTIDIKRDYSS